MSKLKSSSITKSKQLFPIQKIAKSGILYLTFDLHSISATIQLCVFSNLHAHSIMTPPERVHSNRTESNRKQCTLFQDPQTVRRCIDGDGDYRLVFPQLFDLTQYKYLTCGCGVPPSLNCK